MNLSKATPKRAKVVLECLDVVLASSCPISRLSDDALLHLFAYFPLHRILTHFRLVCTRWNSMVFTLCASKRSLKLFTSPNPIAFLGRELSLLTPQHYARLRLRDIGHDHDLIIGPKFNAQTCALFHFLFPRVEFLLIEESNCIIFLPHLARLLSGWQTLLSFSLYGALPKRSGALQQTQLYEALGKLSQLRHLDLLVDGLLGNSASRKIMAPILGRLEHFSCRIRKSRIKTYLLGGLSAACTSLRFDAFPGVHQLGSYMAPGVFGRITVLSITETPLTQEELTLLVSAFPALTDFTLDWGSWSLRNSKLEPVPTLERFIAPLSALSSLESLRLRVPYEIFIGTDFYQQSDAPSPYTCLSLRYLSLQVTVPDNHRLAFLGNTYVFAYLAGSFPNLASLTFFPLLCGKSKNAYSFEVARRQCREFIEPKVRKHLREIHWPEGGLEGVALEESSEGLGRHREAYLAGINQLGVEKMGISEEDIRDIWEISEEEQSAVLEYIIF